MKVVKVARWGVVFAVPLILAFSTLVTQPASAATSRRPSAVRHIRATAGNNSAIVTFSPPANNGGTRVIDYYIKPAPGASAIRKCASTRCRVLGLSDGKAYYFSVAAVTRWGVGPYATSNVIYLTPPTPTNVTITYEANAATATGTMASETEPYDTTADLTLNQFVNSGYVFKDWSTNSSGTGTVFTNGESVKFTGSITLYAQWTSSAALVTITFVGDGASGVMAPEVVPYGVATALSANTLTYPGYSFAGWSLTPGGAVSYVNGATVNLTSNVILYALWSSNTPAFSGETSPNWSGYVLPSATNSAVFTYVSGEWVVPTLNCADTPNNSSATWVGTGGFGWASGGSSGVLLQTGTEDDCINGSQSDSGWFEIYPSTPNTQETFRDFPVSPGDLMLAKIEINTDDEWTTVLENLTTGLQGVFSVGYEWDVAYISNNDLVGPIQGTATGTSYSGGDSAEWVTEDTGVAYSSSTYPFVNFGTVTFSDLETDLSSWTLPPSDAVEIVQGGSVLAVPGTVNNDGFTITYTGP